MHSGPGPRGVIDHLVVTAPSLDAGDDLVAEALGIRPSGGGRHERMGTHNHVLRTGDTTYLEVIAVDPEAAAPDRPRWFGLDAAIDAPGLALWVARTDDIAALASQAAEPLGPIEPMTRGDISWQLTIPSDGSVPLDGIGPGLLQWDGAPVATRLPESGVRLVSLTLRHPQPDRVKAQLASLGFAGPLTVQADLLPGLLAAFDTPDGPAFLGTRGREHPSLDTERQIAIDLFNLTWTYLDMDSRTPDEDAAMLAATTASAWHWRHAGAAHEWAIAEWQLSRVHAVLGDGEQSLHHARECLAIAEGNRVDDFVPASAHEALSRAYAVLGDLDAAREERNRAYRIAVDLDDEDRDVIEHDLGTLPIP